MDTESSAGYCLNCETPLQGKFCHACGQKASTHRITLKKFIEHDLLHGIFHFDRGIFFTLQALFFVPGHTARRYLHGKRVKHYNIFALFIIVITLKMLLDSQTVTNNFFSSDDESVDVKANLYLRRYYKLIYFLYIPILASFSRMLFGRLRLNFTEHMVAAAFALTSGQLFALFLSLIGYFTKNHDFVFFGFIGSILYLVFPYYQFSKIHYSFKQYSWRAVLFITFIILMLMVGLIIVVLLAYDGNFEGQIGLSLES